MKSLALCILASLCLSFDLWAANCLPADNSNPTVPSIRVITQQAYMQNNNSLPMNFTAQGWSFYDDGSNGMPSNIANESAYLLPPASSAEASQLFHSLTGFNLNISTSNNWLVACTYAINTENYGIIASQSLSSTPNTSGWTPIKDQNGNVLFYLCLGNSCAF